MNRNRMTYAVLILTVILLGLASRADLAWLPVFVRQYAGDTLWALAAYLSLAFFFPSMPIKRVAAAAALFSFSVEVSQLYHAPWIEKIREVRLGGLLLGHGFLWSDLICYGAGICFGVLLERAGTTGLFSNRRSRSRPRRMRS